MTRAGICRLLLLSTMIATISTALILQDSSIRSLPTRYHNYHNGRSCLSMAEEIEPEPEVASDGETSSSIASCPFSKTFPRYRIDLTTSRKNRKQKQQKEEGVWSLLPIPSIELPSLELPSPPWEEAMQRNQVERAVRERQKRKTGTDSKDLEILVQPGYDGVEAFAFLFEESARLMGIRDDGKPNSSSKVILGLPDTSESVVQNFVEIVEWMGATMTTESEQVSIKNPISAVYNGCILTAELIKEENLDIPTICLERVSLPSSSYNTHADEEINHFPSAAAEKIINERTRMWVKRILVEQGICPFTKSDRMSGQGLLDLGVPVGSIAYHASFQRHPIGLFADTWKAIDAMIKAGPEGRNGVSSILLAAPEFDDDFDVWAGPIFAMLEAGVVAAGAESQVGVVCFHPRYATPDGKSWPGFGHMHSVPRLEKWYKETTSESSISAPSSSECILTTEQIAAGGAWQRRTPHSTINVLRADQLEAAESRRVSGKMYTENIDKLVGANGIGNEKLAMDLQREREEGANLL